MFSVSCSILYIIVCLCSFGHCIVWSSSIYGFCFPVWYFQTFLEEICLVAENNYQEGGGLESPCGLYLCQEGWNPITSLNHYVLCQRPRPGLLSASDLVFFYVGSWSFPDEWFVLFVSKHYKESEHWPIEENKYFYFSSDCLIEYIKWPPLSLRTQ